MTISKTKNGGCLMHCDDCNAVLGDSYEDEIKSFNDIIQEAKDAKWSFEKVGNFFCHVCPDCVEWNKQKELKDLAKNL